MIKRILLGLVGFVLLVAFFGGLFAFIQIRAFDESIATVYEVPLPQIDRSTDEAVLARGKHLAEGIGGCAACHGANLGGGKVEDIGPVGKLHSPNITAGTNGAGSTYSDAEMARLIKHGIRKDGTSARFMPSRDYAWWPDADLVAVISYVRSLPPVDSGPSQLEIGPLGKFLDRMDMMPLDVARRIDHANMPTAPAPEPTAAYGQFIAINCKGCHGETLSGGAIPGAPPELPVPLNLTPHDTGLKGWTYADFEKLMREGIRKNGKKLDPFMPTDSTKNYDDVEMRALWAYLQSLPAAELGNR